MSHYTSKHDGRVFPQWGGGGGGADGDEAGGNAREAEQSEMNTCRPEV